MRLYATLSAWCRQIHPAGASFRSTREGNTFDGKHTAARPASALTAVCDMRTTISADITPHEVGKP